MKLSSYQQAILEAVRYRLVQPGGQLPGMLIEALAGTGKSFILVEICKLLKEEGVQPNEVRLVVFGKKNKADLADKLAKKVGSEWQNSVSTLHSLSYAILREALNVPGNCFKIESNKYRSIAEELQFISYWEGRGKSRRKEQGILWEDCKCDDAQTVQIWDTDFLQLIELLRLYCYEPTHERIHELAILHKLDFPLIPSVVHAAKKVLDQGLFFAIRHYWIDYADMSWVLWMEREHHQITLEKWRKQFRLIAVDECQDTDLLQLNILSLLVDPSQSFLVAVGDRRQAVYAFRGCVSDGLDRFQSQFDCDSYPLPVNYRCGKKHLELVRRIYPDIPIEAHPGAGEGEIKIVKDSEFLDLFSDPQLSYIGVCRKNAPLISAAIKLLGAGKPAKIKDKSIGRKIIDQIEKITKRLKADYEVETFPSLVEEFEMMERSRLSKYDDGEQRMSELQDLLSAILALFEAYEPATIKSWSEIIDKIFDESGHAPINLYSIHSGKGGEGDVAFILNPENMPMSHKGMTAEERAPEHNLIYVALTRPQKILALVSSEPQKISWLPRDFFEPTQEPENPLTEPETKEEKLCSLGFFQTDIGEEGEPLENYRGWSISLSAPNEGIIGITLKEPSGDSWHCGTEFLEPPLSYFDTEGHLSYARRAIDAAETSPRQLALPLEVSAVMEVEKSEASQVMESFSQPITEILPDKLWEAQYNAEEDELLNLLDKLQSLSKPRLRTIARELIDRLGPEVFAELLS